MLNGMTTCHKDLRLVMFLCEYNFRQMNNIHLFVFESCCLINNKKVTPNMLGFGTYISQ